MHLSLAELAITPDDDAGTTWHPHPDKTAARSPDGNLADLDDPAVHEHIMKPESDEQVDGLRRRQRERRAELAAEDSLETSDGEV